MKDFIAQISLNYHTLHWYAPLIAISAVNIVKLLVHAHLKNNK